MLICTTRMHTSGARFPPVDLTQWFLDRCLSTTHSSGSRWPRLPECCDQAGLACIIAPSRGKVHRYPLDCWRFYPDAAAALCAYVGMDLLESYVEPPTYRKVGGKEWGDFTSIARRPKAKPRCRAKASGYRVHTVRAAGAGVDSRARSRQL